MVDPPTGSAGHAGKAAATTHTPRARGWSTSRKDRAGHELLCERLYRPLAHGVVRALLPLRIAPTTVVAIHTVLGLVAAALIWRESAIAAAVLLQLKTVLDNADGQLARASGRVTDVGRFLDTECDALVNMALFVALGWTTGEPVLAIVAFLTLTLVLTVDYNVGLLYGEARQAETVVAATPAPSGALFARTLAHIYAAVFAPQDRVVRRISQHRLARLLAGARDDDARGRATLAYHDRTTATILANFGLSTQLAALGLLLVVDVPRAYLWLVLCCGLALPMLQLRRELRARAALRG